MEKKLNDTQEYILSVLNSVIKATNEMNVKCYMQGGTMLGAIRHGGFIPWDDDVDLGIMRNEYEIFLKNVKKYLPGNLELRTYWDESDHHYYFARIVDKRYLIKRMGSAEIRYENVWVDIFPLDGMPSNIFALKVHQFRLALARLMYHLSCIKKVNIKRPGRSAIEKAVISIALKFPIDRALDTKKCLDKVDVLLKKYPVEESKWIINFMGQTSFKYTEMIEKSIYVLFGVVALICAYYLFKPEKRMTRSFKILLASAVGLIVLYLLSFSVPEISAIFERFSHIGSDEESNTRFMMWALALKNFKENPLIGIGWNGYKYQFYHFLYNPAVRAERYAYLNAHNVYLQLLCETGILGFLIFMSGAIELFVRTLKLLKKNIRDSFSIGSKGTIFFVLTMQIFFWLYSLTGNCLYDTMFGFYSVSIGFVLGYLVQKKNIKEEIYNEKDRNINIS